MAEQQYLSYVMNKRFGGQSENEFMSSGTDFAYSQNINIYESPKYIELSKEFLNAVSTTAVTDAHGATFPTDSTSANYAGMKITTKKRVKLTTVNLLAACESTFARLTTDAGTVLQTVAISSNTATFNYILEDATTYRIECGAGGSIVKYGLRVAASMSYPYSKTNFDYIAGSNNGTDSTAGFNIVSIVTQQVPAPSGIITKILRLPNDIQSNAYFTSTGQIWIEATAGTPTLAFTITKADKYILNAVCFTSFLLVFTATEIHKVTFTGNDFKTYASTTESLLAYTASYQGFSANESKDLPIYNFKDTLLYFGAGNKLFSIGNTLVAVSTSETLRIGSKIVGLSFLNSNLKIYVNYLNVSGSLYFWNETSSDSINYENRVFKAVHTDGQLDYAVCADGLYIYNGYTGEKLFNYNFNDFGHTGSLYVVPQNLMCIDPYFWYVAYNKNIFKFGKKFTNLPNGFSISSVETNNLTAISDKLTVTGTLYYADDTKTIMYQGSTYKTTGYIEGVVFYGDVMEKIKKVDRIFQAFDVPTGCSIDVYFSIEGAAYPGSPNYTISASTTKKWKELFANELPNLTNHRIKPKIVMNSNGTTTPKLYEWDMFSEYIKNI